MRSRAQRAVMTVRTHMTCPVTSPESQGCPHTPSLPGAFPRTTGRKLLPASFSWEDVGPRWGCACLALMLGGQS